MKWLIILFTSIITFKANSIQFEDAIFPELAPSARALAMGNAYLCKVDDASAAFYNPAGLGTVRFPHVHLSNFYLDMNQGLLNAGFSGSMTNVFSNMANLFSLDGTRKILKNRTNNPTNLNLGVLPNITTRYFSLGYLYGMKRRAVITSMVSATGFEFADRTDHGPYAALNFSFFGGIIKVGTSALYLVRKELISSSDPNTAAPTSYQNGTMPLITSGVRVTAPVELLPTVAATWHNTLNQSFSMGSGLGVPAKVPSAIDIGVSLTPQLTTSSRLHFEINYKDFTSQVSGVNTVRKFLMGAELDIYRVFFFRLGYGDGFGSAGIGVKSRAMEFDFSTYAVDTTTALFRGKEDRRFIMSVSSGL